METRLPAYLVLAALVAAVAAPGLACATARSAKPPASSCEDLARERGALLHDSKLTTSDVEAKNTEVGETADALKAATTDSRKAELQRRLEGLRRELSALEDKEQSQVNRLGALDAEIAKRGCKVGGAR